MRSGLDESSRFLTEARVELLNPERRRQVDEELAAQAEEQAVAEFHKYVVFALNDKTLSPQEEETLLEFGRQHGLSDERMLELIEAELRNCGGVRVTPPPPEESTAAEKTKAQLDPKEDFMRMLRLSGLDADDMTDDQRDAFVNMAENLGIEPGDAEDFVDLYLEEIEKQTAPAPVETCHCRGSESARRFPQWRGCRPSCCTEDSDPDRRRGRTGKVSQFYEQHRH